MNQEEKNIRALFDFKSNLVNSKEHGHDGTMTKCKIKYFVGNNTESEILDVYIYTTFEPVLRFDIFENGSIITSENFHVDFNPKFNKFSFSINTKTLTIEGNSPKLGNYKVEIFEF